ncbi:uncharacterized protein CG3556-like [Artemia franciscana]|uniref:uncharacterized protein CG3556-like n=1 Tax=Artemia franciscana TaxID=6661 RepID=UPI0032DA483C
MDQYLLLCSYVLLLVGKLEGLSQDADFAIATGIKWLETQQDLNYGWGEETPRVVTTLALLGRLNHTRENGKTVGRLDSDIGPQDCSNSLQQLVAKQLEVELMLELWRPRTDERNPGKLSLFILAFTSLCYDVRNFHGHDVLSQLLRHEPEAPYELGLSVLATCAAGGYPKRRLLRKIAEIVNDPPQLHMADVLSLSAMALICVARNGQRETTVPRAPIQIPSQTGIQKAVSSLLKSTMEKVAKAQEADGSFGNEFSTSLAVQALTNLDYRVDGWDERKAEQWLIDRLQSDGSFGTVGITSQILLALAGDGGFSQIDRRNCPSGTTQKGLELPLEVAFSPSAIQSKIGVQITYILWIDRNVTDVKELEMKVPEKTTFFEVMKAAAELDPNYEFSATIWPNGHYVHTIGGRREQPIGFHFWLLYRLPFRPDPKNPPPTDYVAPSGVDDIIVQNGDYFLFWYKNI